MTTTSTYKSTRIPLGRRHKSPFVFEEFFKMGLEESASPFLTYHARDLSRNFSLKVSITAAILLFFGYLISSPLSAYYPFSQILLALVYVIAGVPLLIDSVEDIVIRRDVNIDVLMTLAAFSAYFLGAGFEGGLLLVLFALSGSLEATVSLKAKSALSSIYSIAPSKAYLVGEGGVLLERAVQDVSVGAIIFVRIGEVVPLDGVIISGASSMNLQHLTGESMPMRKQRDDVVVSGSRAIDGALTIQVTHTSYDSTVSRIIRLITTAQESKPKLERFFDRFSQIYAISIITFSFCFALFLAHIVGIPYLGTSGAVYRALAFLITASPCALILAVPIAYLSALGACARKGFVLKGGVVFDALNTCHIVAFDKTGTLTLGDLTLKSIEGLKKTEFSQDELLEISYSLERGIVHPIAQAIVKKAEEKKLAVLPVSALTSIPGSGVQGRVLLREKEYLAYIGDIAGIRAFTMDTNQIEQVMEERRQKGELIAILVLDKEAFLLSFEDNPREGVSQLVGRLEKRGYKVLMLTGDHKESAERVARVLHIREFFAGLKPEDKMKKITELSKTEGLAMVGDGINDAPALARATVGIAMGKIGSATAQGVADVVLLHDNIEGLDWLFEKAKKTKKIVFENLTLALSVICLASAFALAGDIPLWLAVCLHEGGTVLVALNAIRLLKNEPVVS